MEGDKRLKRFALACAVLILLAVACGTAWSCQASPANAGRGGQETDVPEDDGEAREAQGGEEPGTRPPAESGEGDGSAGETKKDSQGETPSGGEVKNPQETLPGELPEAWDYVEEDGTAVTLSGKEALAGILPEDALAGLEDGLLVFLKENGEYRRELEVVQESVAASDGRVTFRARFRTGRLDGKEIAAAHGGDGFTFSMEEPGANEPMKTDGQPVASGRTEVTGPYGTTGEARHPRTARRAVATKTPDSTNGKEAGE